VTRGSGGGFPPYRGEGTQLARNRDTRYFGLRELGLKRKSIMKAPESLARSGVASLAAPSPARHGGCKKNRNRRAACPLPRLSGRGIFGKRWLPILGRGIFGKTSSRKSYCPLLQLSERGILRKPSSRDSYCALPQLLSSANHSDSSGLARALALSFSRVAAARRIPVLPDVLPRNSGFLARARHARGNDRKIRPSGGACHYLVQDSISWRGSFRKPPSGDT
jgi:hypothetical protein